jgi:hypothetical protein
MPKQSKNVKAGEGDQAGRIAFFPDGWVLPKEDDP